MMIQPVMYQDARGKKVEAIRLTKDNQAVVVNWCGGHPVVTYDAIEHDEVGQVGVNFNGRHQTERVSEGEFLIRKPGFPIFFKMDVISFHAKYERA